MEGYGLEFQYGLKGILIVGEFFKLDSLLKLQFTKNAQEIFP